ncbi:MAG: hypothetical protein HY903_08035 [Deltaproteobacteria bacterium]|nr:hypothetical protein [Deltaproteobacteria bacterium]
MGRRTEWIVTVLLCGAITGARCVWPGDTQWINDEPLLLAKAAAMNATGTLATEGLRGTVGVTYGPGAVWIYAGLLRLTCDLVDLVV